MMRERRGVAALEFAVIAPVLLLLFFGMARVGHALGVQHALTQLAASAARQALPAGRPDLREALARQYVMTNASTYTLLEAGRIEFSARESGTTLSVLVTMDVSHIPDIPIVSAAYRFPTTQTAFAAIAVQN